MKWKGNKGKSLLEMVVYQGRDHSDIAADNPELADRIESFLSGL